MARLIKSIDKDFPEFWDLSIALDGNEYRKTFYDSINISLLVEHLTDDKNSFLVIVTPDDPTRAPLFIVESLLSLLKRESLVENPQVLEGITPGDSVIYLENGRKSKPYLYVGTEEYSNGKILHKVIEDNQSAFPVTRYIPIERQYLIQPYRQAQTLKRRRGADLVGEKLEKILKLPPGGLFAFQKSKTLYVSSNKHIIKEQISSISLGGDALTSIFPVADYASEDSFALLGSDPLRREPVCGLISNADVAVNKALADSSIRLIMIDGASKVHSSYGSLERIRNDDAECDVVCLLAAENESEIKTLINLGAKVWIWKRKDFAKCILVPTDNKLPDDLAYHEKMINALSDGSPRTIVVPMRKDLEDLITSSFGLIAKIKDTLDADESEEIILLRWAISIINNLLELPMPLEDYHQYLDTINSKYSRLDSKFKSFEAKVTGSYGFSIPINNKRDWKELIDNIQLLYYEIEKTNPKWAELQKLVGPEENKTTLVCLNDGYAGAIRILYPSLFAQIITSEGIGTTTAQHAVVSGWHSRRMASKLFLSPFRNLQYLLYPHEQIRYQSVEGTHPSSPFSKLDNNLRSYFEMEDKEENHPLSQSVLPNIANLIDEIEVKSSQSIYKLHLQEYGDEDLIDCYRIEFEENAYIYATANQFQYVVNDERNHIYKRQIKELNIGDVLIFANSQRNLFEDLLSIIRKTGEYEATYKEANSWHAFLTKYMDDNFMNAAELQEKLASGGCNVGDTTLESWVNNEIICPSKKNLQELAQLIQSPSLTKNLNSIIDYRSKIYSLHIQTGRLLVRNIVNAVIAGEDTKVDEEIRVRVADYSRQARLITIKEVSQNLSMIPSRAIGRLFEL